MIKVILYYTNNTHETAEFNSWEDFDWFVHMEGDHLHSYEFIEKPTEELTG